MARSRKGNNPATYAFAEFRFEPENEDLSIQVEPDRAIQVLVPAPTTRAAS